MGKHDVVLNIKEKGAAKASKGISGVTKAVIGLGSAWVAFKGLGIAKKVMTGNIKLFQKQEQANIDLTNALKLSTKAWQAQYNELKEYAGALQKVTVLGDETIMQSMTLAANMGVATEKIKEATKGAIGLSQIYKMDLATSMKYVALAMQGEYTMLRRYIPALRAAKTEAEQAAIVQKTLADGFKMAKGQVRSSAGAMEQLANAWNDLREHAGSFVKILIPQMNKLTSFFQSDDAEKWAKKVAGALAGVTAGLMSLAGVGMTVPKGEAQKYYKQVSGGVEKLPEEEQAAGKRQAKSYAVMRAAGLGKEGAITAAKTIEVIHKTTEGFRELYGIIKQLSPDLSTIGTSLAGVVKAVGWVLEAIQKAGTWWGEMSLYLDTAVKDFKKFFDEFILAIQNAGKWWGEVSLSIEEAFNRILNAFGMGNDATGQAAGLSGAKGGGLGGANTENTPISPDTTGAEQMMKRWAQMGFDKAVELFGIAIDEIDLTNGELAGVKNKVAGLDAAQVGSSPP